MKLKQKPVYFVCLLCLFSTLTACSEKAQDGQTMLVDTAIIIILICVLVLLLTLRKSKMPPETYSKSQRGQPGQSMRRTAHNKIQPIKTEGWQLTGVSGCGKDTILPPFDIETLREHPPGLTLGRQPELCQLVIDHVSVSRQHARIGLSSDELELTIEDLNSSFGTVINGYKLERSYKAVLLADGSKIVLGENAVLKLTRATFEKNDYYLNPGKRKWYKNRVFDETVNKKWR